MSVRANGRGSRSFRPNTERAIYDRDGATCVYCGADVGLTIDHVMPYGLGGPTTRGNGVVCCRSCNQKKGGDAWREYAEVAFAHMARRGEDLSWIDSRM